MHSREVSEYFQAKMKAARRLGLGRVKPSDLPSNAEVREQIRSLCRLLDRDGDQDRLSNMRMRALWWMHHLDDFHPKLIGSVLTGEVRVGSDIDLHLYTNHPALVMDRVESLGMRGDLQRKRLVKDGQTRVFTHLQVRDRNPVELTIYPRGKLGHRWLSSITGKTIETASAESLARLITFDHGIAPENIERQLRAESSSPSRWTLFAALLAPLENVLGHRDHHPEGDTLYHSLQVFDLARQCHAYDEEFLLAALLHDVGKGIDPADHVEAGIEALGESISDRTRWMIRHHMDAHRIADRSIGFRARRRFSEHPWFDDLMSLQRCDRDGRQVGVETPCLEDALDEIETIEERFS